MDTFNIYVTHQGTEQILGAPSGWQVMEILRDYGYPIKAECGGSCCCATCHVYIDPEWVSKLNPMKDDEEAMLDSALELKENSRLSCQLIMAPHLDGLRLTIAPNPT